MENKLPGNQSLMKTKIKEITPEKFLCMAAACPSVFETDERKLLIIGKKLNTDGIPEKVKKKIGNDETVIEVPKNLIMDLLKK